MKDLIIKIKGDISGFKDAINNVKAQASSLQGHLESIGGAMKKTGATMTAGAAAVGAGLALAVRETMRFEDAMANVRKTTGMTKDELKDLEKGLRELAETIPLSHEELANIAAVAGQLGIQGKENILAFTETVAKAATAFDMTASEAATAMAKLANIYNIPIKQIDRLASAINALGNTTAASENEIIRAMYQIGAAGAQLGATQQQIAAMTATLISMGMAPERAGTRLQSAFNMLGENVEKVAEDMDVSVEEVKKMFEEDFYGTLMKYVDILAKKYPNKMDFLTRANKVFGTVGAKAILSLAQSHEKLTQNLETATKAYEQNISLNQEFEARTDTLSAKLQTLKNMFTDVAIEVGEALLPVLKEIIPIIKENIPAFKEFAVTFTKELIPALRPFGELLMNLIKWFNSLSEPVKQNIARFAALATAISAVAGPILMVAGTLLPYIGAALTALTGPIGIVIAAIAVFAAAWVGNWFGIRDKTFAAIEAIKGGIEFAAKWVNDTIQDVANFISSVLDLGRKAYEWGRNLLGSFVDGIKSMFRPLTDAVSWVADQISAYLGVHSDAEKGALSDLTKWGVNLSKTIAEGIRVGVPYVETAAKQVSQVIENTTLNTTFNIQATIREEADIDRLVDMIDRRLARWA